MKLIIIMYLILSDTQKQYTNSQLMCQFRTALKVGIMKRTLLSSVCAAVIMAAAASPAQAINCREGFQFQRNGEVVSTPYCEAEFLAKLAREHGFFVTGADIRHDPEAMDKACQIAGGDYGTLSTCAPINGGVDFTQAPAYN
jgi:hypothetical protein